ncbi:MAG: HD domain-containing protein [Clostridia bacterium]|nr:HD domain-containing protein [Clostridia bacterium]
MWRDIRLEQEKQLSPLAAHSVDTLGRRLPEEPCKIRSDYERDADRILYSEDFRRLRHKTQVFFNAKSDHICTRMEHVLYVRAISVTIGRTLGLNQDLINAIALGHDVGHAPFGHTGERVLDSCVKKINPSMSFRHEYHSLRVVDRLCERISREKIYERNGLNLTYEVRDGIVSHCGENYDEYILYADKMKDPNLIYETEHRKCMPYTLEACVVRLVDKIAYVGRDIEDAIRAKLIDYKDINPEIKRELGSTNGEMINALVLDLIENSYNTEYIRLSRAKGEALREMILTNNKQIYQSSLLRRYEITAKNAIEGLFEILYENAKNLDRKNKSKTMQRLISYIDEKGYKEDEAPEQIVMDYIAGMTDAYALQTFEDLYWI